MLGWEVFVFRMTDDSPQSDPEELLIANWMTGPFGLQWIDKLVEEQRAVLLGGIGYPLKYSIATGVLLPTF